MTETDLTQCALLHDPHAAARIFGGEAVIVTPAANVIGMLNPWDPGFGSWLMGRAR
jgi:hypothetical protein